MANDIQGRDLSTGYINPLYLRIGKYNGGKAIYRSCHFYIMNSENQLDLFRANGLRLDRFASFNNASFVEEIDNFPEEETAPESETENTEATTVPLLDDDIFF